MVHGPVRPRFDPDRLYGSPVDRSWRWGPSRPWPNSRARRRTRRPKSNRAGSFTRFASVIEASLASAAATSTTAPWTRPRFSLCFWGSCALGRRRTRARTPARGRPRPGLDRHTATATVTDSSSTSARPTGLRNQGWKDSWDGINFADGTLAEPPDRALRGAGLRLRRLPGPGASSPTRGDDATAEQWAPSAAELKHAFNERFWLPDQGCFASRLDRDKRRSTRCAPTSGTACGAGSSTTTRPPSSPTAAVAGDVQRLGCTHPRLDMGAYNPLSYHNGSVWPHDNALDRRRPDALRIRRGAQPRGIRPAGCRRSVRRPPAGVVLRIRPRALSRTGRLPDLVLAAGLGIRRTAVAGAQPDRFDPSIPDGDLWIAPTFPEGLGEIFIGRLPLAGDCVSVELVGNHGQCHRAPRCDCPSPLATAATPRIA